MRASFFHRLVIVLLCCLCLPLVVPPAEAQIGPSKSQAIGILAIIVGIGAAAGIGIYYVVRKAPSITGCAVTKSAGLSLLNESDKASFLLIGDIANIKSGERVRVSGKKKKKDAASGERSFLVEKVSKDFGPCSASALSP